MSTNVNWISNIFATFVQSCLQKSIIHCRQPTKPQVTQVTHTFNSLAKLMPQTEWQQQPKQPIFTADIFLQVLSPMGGGVEILALEIWSFKSFLGLDSEKTYHRITRCHTEMSKAKVVQGI